MTTEALSGSGTVSLKFDKTEPLIDGGKKTFEGDVSGGGSHTDTRIDEFVQTSGTVTGTGSTIDLEALTADDGDGVDFTKVHALVIKCTGGDDLKVESVVTTGWDGLFEGLGVVQIPSGGFIVVNVNTDAGMAVSTDVADIKLSAVGDSSDYELGVIGATS